MGRPEGLGRWTLMGRPEVLCGWTWWAGRRNPAAPVRTAVPRRRAGSGAGSPDPAPAHPGRDPV